MPSVLPTIPNDPPQGIQALLDKVYLWNPDVSNELIEKVNALLTKLGDAIGAIRPYNEMVAPINQYEPCYYGDGVYVAKNYLAERAEEFNEEDWILIATKTDETKLLSKEEAAEIYLPLSGGTMTGTLEVQDGDSIKNIHGIRFGTNFGAMTPNGNSFVIEYLSKINNKWSDQFSITPLYGWIETKRLVPFANDTEGSKEIGTKNRPWTTVYSKQLHNGGVLNVPTLAGTLARLEDLTAGNVSITFAGQEDTLQNAINTLKTDQDELGDQVSAIESKIPADASETNQLVTKNEVLALPTFTYTVVNELPETGEEKIIYLVPKAGEGNDIHDEYIWVNGGYELIGTTAVDLSGYLPLTGGEMTGLLTLNATSKAQYHWFDAPLLRIKAETEDGSTKLDKTITVTPNGALKFSGCFIVCSGFRADSTFSDIGSATLKWRTIYVTKLNNGADIAIPTTGGTIALAEDIAESVTTKDLTVGTEEGTLNIGITAGVATIATNNGLDIVSQTKFDTAPTTDDATAWADVNATALVTKAQVTTALSAAGGGTSVTIRNWA